MALRALPEALVQPGTLKARILFGQLWVVQNTAFALCLQRFPGAAAMWLNLAHPFALCGPGTMQEHEDVEIQKAIKTLQNMAATNKAKVRDSWHRRAHSQGTL